MIKQNGKSDYRRIISQNSDDRGWKRNTYTCTYVFDLAAKLPRSGLNGKGIRTARRAG